MQNNMQNIQNNMHNMHNKMHFLQFSSCLVWVEALISTESQAVISTESQASLVIIDTRPLFVGSNPSALDLLRVLVLADAGVVMGSS